jgi:hypothetical protein
MLAAWLMFVSPSGAYPYTPWVGATGDRTLGLNPYVVVDQDGLTTLNPYVLFGWTDHFDVIAGYALDLEPGSGAASGPIELLPRAIFSDGFILAPHLWHTPGGDTELGFEVHGSWVGERFMFTHNTGANTVLGAPSGALFTMLAPEVRVGRFWLFTEVNPTMYVDAGTPSWDLTLVPGATVSLDAEEYHLLTLGVPVTIGPEAPYAAIGLAYWGTFEFGR